MVSFIKFNTSDSSIKLCYLIGFAIDVYIENIVVHLINHNYFPQYCVYICQ